MLGYLLGRAGVNTVVLEKHVDFLRDFRGDTVHPSTMQIMQELGLLEDFLKRPHSRIPSFSAEVGRLTFRIADFARVPTSCRFIALMPQWDFLNFLLEKGRRFPRLRILMQAQVMGLIRTAGRFSGVEVTTPDGPLRRSTPASWSAVTVARRPCARRLLYRSRIWGLRLTCSGSVSRNDLAIR